MSRMLQMYAASVSFLVLIVASSQNFSSFRHLSSATLELYNDKNSSSLSSYDCDNSTSSQACVDDDDRDSFVVASQVHDRGSDTNEDDDEEESFYGENWYDGVPSPPLVIASSKSLRDGACKRQLRRYLRELRNGTLWAMQMFDASAKQPYGIFDGQTRHLGSFDQCQRIRAGPAAGGEQLIIKGRYCLVDYKYEKMDGAGKVGGLADLDIDFDPNESAWESIREKGDFRRIKRYKLQMALCAPSACSPADIESALRAPFEEFAGRSNLVVGVRVHENNCQAADEDPAASAGTYAFCAILATLVSLVALSTLYDCGATAATSDGAATARILLCFSARRNLRTIFEVSHKHRGLDTIHFLRFFFILCVILGHRIMQYYLNPIVNGRYLEGTFKMPSMVLIHNGTIIVDGFFAIGGLLTCYALLFQFDKSRRMNFAALAVLRFCRLTPAYALLIFFNAYLFPLLGSGPQWKSHVVQESRNCADLWWANLLYLNNYLTMDRLCIFQSWYLSVDFHCYLVAIFMIYAFWRLPRKLGYATLGAATLLSLLIPFYTTYVHRVQPLFIGFPYIQTLTKEPYFLNYYVKSHHRMTAYFVGVVAGAMLYDYEKAPTWRLSKAVSQALAPLVLALAIYSQRLAFEFFDPNSQPSNLISALYATLHRATFAAATCLVVLLATVGDGLDAYYNFMTPGWLQPLSRLTYSVFITHNIIQKYHIGSVRAARTFSASNVFWEYLPDVVFSFFLALLVAICIEGPFRKLEKIFLMKRGTKETIRESNDITNPDRMSEIATPVLAKVVD